MDSDQGRASSRPAHVPTGSSGDGRERAVWLLDVDGVLNAHDPGWGGAPASGWARALGGTFRITWAPAMVERLLEVGAAGAVEVRWATTWVPWIEQIEGLLGLPRWPSAFELERSSPAVAAPHRKLDAALRVVEDERRRLVWTDDDAIPWEGPELYRLTAGPHPALLVRPSPRWGLQPEHLARIEAFLAG